MLLVHQGEIKKAASARFEWSEIQEDGKKVIVLRIFDLWGNNIFETLKGESFKNESTLSSWYFISPNKKIVDTKTVIEEVNRLLNVTLNKNNLFMLLDDINKIIKENRQGKSNSRAHKFTKNLTHSTLSVKIILD